MFTGFSVSQLPRSVNHLETLNGALIALAAIALVIQIAAFLANRKKHL